MEDDILSYKYCHDFVSRGIVLQQLWHIIAIGLAKQQLTDADGFG
jgi:hypothetical protein